MERTIRSQEYKALLTILNDLRKDSGLTQIQLAKKLKVRQGWISNVENGERRLDVVELRKIAEALGSDLGAVISIWQQKVRKDQKGVAKNRSRPREQQSANSFGRRPPG